jgi:hypothetical protein
MIKAVVILPFVAMNVTFPPLPALPMVSASPDSDDEKEVEDTPAVVMLPLVAVSIILPPWPVFPTLPVIPAIVFPEVEQKVEILGEAANRVSEEFQSQHVEINWRNTIGLRNVIAHRYDQVVQERLWNIVQTALPDLLNLLISLLPPITPNMK